MTALVRLLATLHDDDGNVAVAGLERARPPSSTTTRSGSAPSQAARRRLADRLRLDLTRLWNKPAITTIGIDATSIDKASNTLSARAHAKISMRLAPRQDPQGLRAAARAPRAARPVGRHGDVEARGARVRLRGRRRRPRLRRWPRASFADAWGIEPVDMGVGGSIPFISDFAARFPNAAIIVTGRRGPRHSCARRRRVAAPR